MELLTGRLRRFGFHRGGEERDPARRREGNRVRRGLLIPCVRGLLEPGRRRVRPRPHRRRLLHDDTSHRRRLEVHPVNAQVHQEPVRVRVEVDGAVVRVAEHLFGHVCVEEVELRPHRRKLLGFEVGWGLQVDLVLAEKVRQLLQCRRLRLRRGRGRLLVELITHALHLLHQCLRLGHLLRLLLGKLLFIGRRPHLNLPLQLTHTAQPQSFRHVLQRVFLRVGLPFYPLLPFLTEELPRQLRQLLGGSVAHLPVGPSLYRHALRRRLYWRGHSS
mmetsp:Transcript_5874/g.16577  ORF Transcript_5874/g.16577 Transcript_5874/m.16577 type:complete len:274 (+) Transcript_5874:1436-2257(+)